MENPKSLVHCSIPLGTYRTVFPDNPLTVDGSAAVRETAHHFQTAPHTASNHPPLAGGLPHPFDPFTGRPPFISKSPLLLDLHSPPVQIGRQVRQRVGIRPPTIRWSRSSRSPNVPELVLVEAEHARGLRFAVGYPPVVDRLELIQSANTSVKTDLTSGRSSAASKEIPAIVVFGGSTRARMVKLPSTVVRIPCRVPRSKCVPGLYTLAVSVALARNKKENITAYPGGSQRRPRELALVLGRPLGTMSR